MNNTVHQTLTTLKPTTLDAGMVFSGKASGHKVRGYAKPCAYTPAIDSDYIFPETSRDVIVWLCGPSEPLYVYGPLGCGKSSLLRQLAARLNYPVFEITGHGRLEFADRVGHLTVQNGNMAYEYGPLALAMRYGGLFLLNEIDLVSPEVAAGLNGILDGSPLCIAENGGELVRPHPMFRFAATANSNGGGDDTGLYQGVQRQNAAFLDRFTLCELGYPDAATEETPLLQRRFPALPADLCEKMVAYANEVRGLFMGAGDITTNSIEVTFSTRSLLRWGELTQRFQPLARQGIQPITYALDRALGYRACRETRAMLHELARRFFPQQDIPKTAAESAPDTLSGQEAIDLIRQHFAVDIERPHRVYLRCEHTLTNGASSTKFWQGENTHAELMIRWGREGTTGQQKVIPVAECSRHSPGNELLERATRKLREGYELNLNQSTL